MATEKQGKFMLLTGASSGIGLEATKTLCSRGHKLVVTVRSVEKGEQCIRDVKEAVPDANIDYMLCEMSDPESIKAFVRNFQKKWLVNGRTLDVLINNAGAMFMMSKKRVTCDANPAWEKTVTVNAIAPVLLTDLLTDNLKETVAKKGEARVVYVSSTVTNRFENESAYVTDVDDIMLEKPGVFKPGYLAYKNSKVCLNLACLAQAEELKGSGVTLNMLCPGPIPGTNFHHSSTANAGSSIINRLKLRFVLWFTNTFYPAQTPVEGGQYIVQVADEKQGKSHGIFFYRGDVEPQASQIVAVERQTKVLNTIRELVA